MSEQEDRREASDPLSASRLGLFGGSFDPIHLGHLHVAETAQRAFKLDRILFVPAAQSPHKSNPTSADAEDRRTMVELAVKGRPDFSCSDRELLRGAPSFTIDTVRELLRERQNLEGAELFLILGSDNLEALGSWREIEEILSGAQPIVVARRGVGKAALEGLRELPAKWLDRLRAGFVDAETVDVAASDLREQLSRGEGIDQLPAPVWEYIRTRGIYGIR